MTIDDVKKLLIKLRNNVIDYKVKMYLAHASYFYKELKREIYRVTFNINNEVYSILPTYDDLGIKVSKLDETTKIEIPFNDQKEKYEVFALIEEIKNILTDNFENDLLHFINNEHIC